MTVLTVIAGAVDAVSFLTLGKVFCARVTGNALFPSFAPVGEGDVPVARAAAAVAAFPAGAAPGGPALAGLAARGCPRCAKRLPAARFPPTCRHESRASARTPSAALGAPTTRPRRGSRPLPERARAPGRGSRVGRPRATRPRSPRRCRRSPPCGPR
ncbi:DUF1275 family protein [Streptomyces griseoincarnatus]